MQKLFLYWRSGYFWMEMLSKSWFAHFNKFLNFLNHFFGLHGWRKPFPWFPFVIYKKLFKVPTNIVIANWSVSYVRELVDGEIGWRTAGLWGKNRKF